MGASFRSIWATLAALALALTVRADCGSYGVDYSNGGSYYIDGSSNQYFSFITVFQGCTSESINPVLVSPSGNEYACSAINTTPAGAQVTSTCGIPFSQMTSGTWKIIVSGQQIAVQRSISLTVGVPQTSTVIATPTIILGITSTPKAQTTVRTVQQTQTLILVPNTITAACNGATRTVTNFPQGPTITITSTVVRTQTDGQKTSYWQTTATTSATCHYPSGGSSSPTSYDNNPITQSAQPSFCIGDDSCRPHWGGKGKGWGWGKKRSTRSNPQATGKRDVAAYGAVQAVTITVTQTTFTVTSTVVTTIPAQTTTEVVFRTTTATVTPAASTICNGGSQPGATVTVNRGNPTTATQTNIAYSTTHLQGTVWVGQTQFTTLTNSASATACWRAGGWYGA